jgi:hypothetical protein
METIVRIGAWWKDNDIVVEKSVMTYDRRDHYDVKFYWKPLDYNYVRKSDIGKPIKQSHAWLTYVYISETQYNENPQKWIDIAKEANKNFHA